MNEKKVAEIMAENKRVAFIYSTWYMQTNITSIGPHQNLSNEITLGQLAPTYTGCDRCGKELPRKDVRTQGGRILSSVHILRTSMVPQMRTSAIFGAKTSDFLKFMVCSHGKGARGLVTVRMFLRQLREEGCKHFFSSGGGRTLSPLDFHT